MSGSFHLGHSVFGRKNHGFKISMSPKKIKIHVIAEELFQFSLVTYSILIVVETIKQGFVTNFFNINIRLFFVLFVAFGRVLPYAASSVRC